MEPTIRVHSYLYFEWLHMLSLYRQREKPEVILIKIRVYIQKKKKERKKTAKHKNDIYYMAVTEIKFMKIHIRSNFSLQQEVNSKPNHTKMQKRNPSIEKCWYVVFFHTAAHWYPITNTNYLWTSILLVAFVYARFISRGGITTGGIHETTVDQQKKKILWDMFLFFGIERQRTVHRTDEKMFINFPEKIKMLKQKRNYVKINGNSELNWIFKIDVIVCLDNGLN